MPCWFSLSTPAMHATPGFLCITSLCLLLPRDFIHMRVSTCEYPHPLRETAGFPVRGVFEVTGQMDGRMDARLLHTAGSSEPLVEWHDNTAR